MRKKILTIYYFLIFIIPAFFATKYFLSNSGVADEKFSIIEKYISEIDRDIKARLVSRKVRKSTLAFIDSQYEFEKKIDMKELSRQLSKLGWINITTNEDIKVFSSYCNTGGWCDYRAFCQNNIKLTIDTKDRVMSLSINWNIHFHLPERCKSIEGIKHGSGRDNKIAFVIPPTPPDIRFSVSGGWI